jgi:hypothetical protein
MQAFPQYPLFANPPPVLTPPHTHTHPCNILQVYAHTSNPLQRRVLARLMRTDCLLPNLYVGTLTRETFMEALEAGLGAEDVTNFLRAHAHPQVASRVVAVPEVSGGVLAPSWEETL